MTLTEVIGVVSGVIGIAGGLYAIWHWLLPRLRGNDIKDPTKPVTKDRLSATDVDTGVARLANEIKAFSPDYIFGINRGGAIVGGMLANYLGLEGVFLLNVSNDKYDVNAKGLPDVEPGQKVLLVDDRYRTGNHMRAANVYLAQTYPNVPIKRAVLLEVRDEGRPKASPPVDYAAYHTDLFRVKCPWTRLNEGNK